MKKFKVLFSVAVIGVMMLFMSLTAMAADKPTITPPVAEVGNEKTTNDMYTFTQADVIDSSYSGVIIPIKVTTSGTIVIDISGVTSGKTMYAELWADPAGEQGYNLPIIAGNVGFKKEVQLTAAGTYYLVVYSSKSSAFTNKFTLKTSMYSSSDRTLSNGKWTVSGNSGRKTLYKVVVSKPGYITVQSNIDMYNVNLYNSSKKALYSYGASLNKDNSRNTTYAVKAGTYYIETSNNMYENYQLRYVFSEDKTLANKSWATFYPAQTKEVTYFKVKASKTGYINVQVGGDTSGYVTLCNSKKKAISSSDWTYAKSSSSYTHRIYGVKAGATYYLKYTGNYSTSKIKYTLTAVKEKSGSKRTNAVTLKKKKTSKGVIIAGDKATDWYKISLPKNQKLTISLKGNSNDSLSVAVYNGKGKEITIWGSKKLYDNGGKLTIASSGKWAKGTYYVKVYRSNSKSSGNYSISWK